MDRKNYFYVGNWEVSFLQDNLLTVCVIRHLKKIDQRFTGLVVFNPKDKWSDAIGRHKALKEILSQGPYTLFTTGGIVLSSGPANQLPCKLIQKAYWEYYGAKEKESK